jgi:hypothetical protein
MTHYSDLLGTARRALPAVALAAIVPLLAACNRVDTGNGLGFWDIIWSMVVFFFIFVSIWIIITIFMDIFRRDDLSGGMKAIWIVALFIFTWLTAIVYIVTRPKATAQDVAMITQAKAAQQAAAGVSKTDQLATLEGMRQAGSITPEQYEKLKAEIIG